MPPVFHHPTVDVFERYLRAEWNSAAGRMLCYDSSGRVWVELSPEPNSSMLQIGYLQIPSVYDTTPMFLLHSDAVDSPPE